MFVCFSQINQYSWWHAATTLLSSDCYAPAACGVVDSLRHSNAEYCVTSRELAYNGSAQYRPKVSFQKEF